MGHIEAQAGAADPRIFLSTMPASSRDRRLAMIVVALSLAVFAAAAPFAQVKLVAVPGFIPIYQSTLAINDLITATLLFAQFAILRTRALLVIACGYLFTATIVIAHTLTFPGLFVPGGLLGAGPQSTAWLYMFWHGGFPLAVIGYALLKRSGSQFAGPARRIIAAAIAVTIATTVAFTAMATLGHDWLPRVLHNSVHTAQMIYVVGTVWMLSLAALVVLCFSRPHSVMDVWLMVVMCAWLGDVALSSTLNGGRFDLGFYAGRAYGLLTATFLLVLFLFSTVALYARLVGRLESEKLDHAREAEARRRLFDTSLDLILVVDHKGRFLQVSPSAQAILGYPSEELIGRNAADFVFPEDLDGVRGQMRGARRGRQMRNFECRYIHRDGRTVPLAWSGVWSAVAQQHYFIGRDMTEQKASEDALREALARQRAIFDSAIFGIVTLNESGSIETVNPAAERLFGYSEAELMRRDLGRRIALGGPPGQPSLARLQELARTGKVVELSAQRADGAEIPIDFAVAEMPIAERRMFVAFAIDITERKIGERMKDEFIATVSHELRTPMTSISGALGLLGGGAAGALSEPVLKLIRIAHGNSQRLVRLINDILDMEKIESGKMKFELRRVEIRPLIEQAIEANRAFAESFKVHMRLDPDCADVAAFADADRLTQVVTNLLSNAVKFSPPDEWVVLSASSDADTIRISVRDHGPGIAEDFKSRIFQKFAQYDATDARQKGGTGLGLSIVQQIVARLEGDVGFVPAPGGGTEFFVTLPLYCPQRLAERRIGERRRAPAGASILLCEDDPDAAEIMCAKLRDAGFRPDVAFTAEDAVRGAAQRPYEAILVDLHLPDGDGITLIKNLRAQWHYQNTPIVVVSANPQSGHDDERAAALNVLDWLSKPVDVERLSRVLNRPIVRESFARPRILHVDGDAKVREAVARGLGADADVHSAGSLAAARIALRDGEFDLAVIDAALPDSFGLDLLRELKSRDGRAIPVIVFSDKESLDIAAQVHAVLVQPRASIERLVAVLHEITAGGATAVPMQKEVA